VRYAKPFLVGASALMVLRLLLHAYLSRYAVPAADDFCYAANAPLKPLLEWLVNEYQHWNGRYLSNVFVGRGPLQWGDQGLFFYRSIPVLLLLATAGVLCVFVRSVMPALKQGASAFIAMALLLLYLDLMPDMGQGIYWYTGAITYQLGNILLLLCLVQFMRWREAPLRRAVTAALLLVLTIGMSETHMFLAVLATAIMTAGKREHFRTLLPVGLVALLCAAVLIVAPGNAERGAFFPQKHDLFRSLGLTVAQTGRFLLTWIFTPALLATSLAFVACYPMLQKHLPKPPLNGSLGPMIAAAILLSIIAACVFPAYWSMGMLAQHRTLNVACFFFIPLWFWLLHLCLDRWMSGYRWPVFVERASVVLAFAALLFAGNGWHALRDLGTGRAERYAHASASRHADQARTCLPMVFPDPPRTLPVFLANKPQDQWMLDCECDYFGVPRAQSDPAN
jgi:hypothetical protein